MGIPTGYTVNIINIESRLSDEPLAAGEASGRRPRSLIIHLKRGEAQLVRLSACHLRETFDQFAHSGFSPSRLLYRTVPMTLGPRPSLKKIVDRCHTGSLGFQSYRIITGKMRAWQ